MKKTLVYQSRSNLTQIPSDSFVLPTDVKIREKWVEFEKEGER